MSNLDNRLIKILEIDELNPSPIVLPPVVIEKEVQVPVPAPPAEVTGDTLVDDIEFARTNIRELINTGTKSLAELKAIAQSSEHPRAYEVLSTLLNTVVELNKDLIEIHKKKRELFKEEPTVLKGGTTNVNVDKAVFLGSTAELGEILKKEQEDDASSLPE